MVTNCSLGDLLSALQGGGQVYLTCDGTITLTNVITITNDTVLAGAGTNATLSGNGALRIFNVASNVNFTISNLTLANGSVVGNAGSNGMNGADSSGIGQNGGNGSNGADAVGGAIYNAGNLTVADCTLQSCGVAGGTGGNGGNGGNGELQGGDGGNGGLGGNALGGAIYNSGQLLLTNSTVSGCSANAGNGGAGGTSGTGLFPGYAGNGAAGGQGSGAGVYNLGSATIVGCAFSGETARGGTSAAAGNTSNGGIGGTGPNGGDSLGAGVCNLGTLVLINCTFSGNAVTAGNGGDGGPGDWQGGNGGNGGSGSGGSLYNRGSAAVTNCTFAGGSAAGGTNGVAGTGGLFSGSDGAPGPSHGGNIATDAGLFYLANSITAYATNGGNGFGSISDSGYNISSDNSVSLSGVGSRTSTDPQLDLLKDNGGPTPTFALLANSPAINSANPSSFPPTDQRGVTRPQGASADIGAVEMRLPTIQTQPQSQDVTNGATAQFTLSATSELPFTCQWQFNGTNISGATSTNYALTNVQSSNAGTCCIVVSNYVDALVSNHVGTVTSQVAVLRIGFAPSIQTQPQTRTVPVGTTVTLTVDASGSTPLNYQWLFNGTNITGATNSSYPLESAQTNNTGSYEVIVTNDFGSVTSQTATLTVGIPPTIISQPESRTVSQGSSVTFSVIAAGTAPLSYQWFFNGTNIPGATNTSFSIASVQITNAGDYSATVSNVVGSTASSNALLKVLVSPQIVGPVLSGSGFHVSFLSQMGLTYTLEFKHNLGDPDWMPVEPPVVINGSGGLVELVDFSATNATRFYRIRVQ